jgi:hypothetical protein
MKSALILGTESSRTKFKNGGMIRQRTIEKILQNEGFRIEVYSENLPNSAGPWDVIVVFSPRRIGLVKKLSKDKSRVWLDFCDSWVYSRFSWTTGPRLFLIGLADAFFLISRRKQFRDCLITYISLYDQEKDRLLLKFLGISRSEVLGNAQEPIKISPQYSFQRRLVFSGDGKYFPNLLAVIELSLLIMPKLAKKIPHKKVNLYGSGWANWVSFLPNLSIVGFTNESLMYSEADVHLAPMRQRAGVKNKIAIPLSLGISVIAYSKAINGVRSSKNLFVASSVKEFAGLIFEVLEKEKLNLSNLFIGEDNHEVNSNIVDWIRI